MPNDDEEASQLRSRSSEFRASYRDEGGDVFKYTSRLLSPIYRGPLKRPQTWLRRAQAKPAEQLRNSRYKISPNLERIIKWISVGKSN